MNKTLLNWKEYFDNTCKGEDMWGHYETKNGNLYVVADGASTHEGSRTGKDVVRYIDERLQQEAAKITRVKHLTKLIHSINTDSSKINEGAYAAIAGILHRGNVLFAFGAGDVSILARKPNSNLIQILPLDLNMEREEAEQTALTEIGTVIDGKEITSENYIQRAEQYTNHGLSNAVGIGESFYLNEKRFYSREGAAILIASDGISDPFIKHHSKAGKVSKRRNQKLYDVIESSKNAEEAADALKDLVWDTQVKDKIKIKADDRTGLFLYM